MKTQRGYVPENFYAPETVNFVGLIEDEAAQKAGIEVIEVVLPGGWNKPFAFVHYLENHSLQEPLRFDTDKVAFMDHFKDPTKESALSSVAPRLVAALGKIHHGKNGSRRSF